jgi:hypothetical protein
MKCVSIAALTLFVAGCAGSQPAVVFRSVAPPSVAAPTLVLPPPAPVVATAVAAQPVAHVPQLERQQPAAEPPPVPPNPLANDCAHMLKHIGESSELFQVRGSSGAADAKDRAARAYLGELEQLDATHPKLHHALKLRIAAVSGWALRASKIDGTTTAEDADRIADGLSGAIQAVGDYCSPEVVEGEAS